MNIDTIQMWSYQENLASCEILDSADQAVHHTEPQFKITQLTLLQRRIRAKRKTKKQDFSLLGVKVVDNIGSQTSPKALFNPLSGHG